MFGAFFMILIIGSILLGMGVHPGFGLIALAAIIVWLIHKALETS